MAENTVQQLKNVEVTRLLGELEKLSSDDWNQSFDGVGTVYRAEFVMDGQSVAVTFKDWPFIGKVKAKVHFCDLGKERVTSYDSDQDKRLGDFFYEKLILERGTKK